MYLSLIFKKAEWIKDSQLQTAVHQHDCHLAIKQNQHMKLVTIILKMEFESSDMATVLN